MEEMKKDSIENIVTSVPVQNGERVFYTKGNEYKIAYLANSKYVISIDKVQR